jgi:NodT family efflux transporter outer membrane factor (OMF) lipoprotein
VLLAFAACTVGPDYEPPEIEVPDYWRAAVEEEMAVDKTALETWWTALNDPVLTDLIRRAELSSLDLAAAVARIQEARALRGVAKGGYWPDIVLQGAFSRTKISENGVQGQAIGTDGDVDGGEGEEGDSGIAPVNDWIFGLDFAWEIDLFGRVRRTVEAATANLQASIEDYRDVLVTLYAEVGAAYIDVRAFQERIRYARDNAESQNQSVQLTQDRFRAGLTSGLDVAQAESNLASTESTIPTLKIGLEASLNRLAVLLGEPPGAVDEELSDPLGVPQASETIMSGVPADLLRRRPDIRRAERLLASQTARIGIATADLYPSFSLTGYVELEAIDFADLGDTGSFGWGIIPGFRWNIFAGGKIRNRIRAEEARTEQALVFYEQSILLALEEVENALVAYEQERLRRDRLTAAVDASRRAVELVHTQYISGLTNFQNYLDSQRSLFDLQDQLADSEGQVVKNLVNLNKALGGGWSPAEADALAMQMPAGQPDSENGGSR